MAEKRRTQRIQPYVARCRVVAGERRLGGYLADLSPRGVRVSCEAPPPVPGEAVILEVRFGRQPGYSRLPAEVKWVKASAEGGGSHVFGLTFTGVTPEEQRVVEAVVEEFHRRAAQLQ